MTVLAIDLGERRIGLAVSDEADRIAFPAGHLEARGGERDLRAVCAWMQERGVDRVVVGLPVHMDGREGPEAAAARAFAERLAARSGRPVELLDERWTSREARRALDEAKASRRRRRRQRAEGSVDAMAAALLLRSFLERSAGGAPAAPAAPAGRDGA